MLYYFIRPFATLSFYIYFRKIYYKNLETVPQDKPVLLASNHPSAFIEPCVYACMLPQPIHFLTRGDIFKGGRINKILHSINLIPIYRFKDGYANLKNNAATFEYCYRALKEKKTIVIFPEGRTKLIKRSDPAQKGAARLAFGAYETNGDIDLQIVPVGINYERGTTFRDEVMVQFGDPIPLRDYYELYAQHETKAVNKLTADLSVAMKKNIVHIEHEEDTRLSDYLLTVLRHNIPYQIWPIRQRNNYILQAKKELCYAITDLPPDTKAALYDTTDGYFRLLKAKGLTNYALGSQNYFSIFNTFVLLIGILPFLLGILLNGITYLLALNVARRKVKHVEFYAPVLWAVWLFSSLFYYAILLGISIWWAGFWNGLLFVGLTMLWGYFSLIYIDFFKRWYSGFRLATTDAATRQTLFRYKMIIDTFINEKKFISE